MGGEATMSILLDTLRKRPMFPSEQDDPTSIDPTTNKPKKVLVYVSQPNLVMKWMPPQAASSSSTLSMVSSTTAQTTTAQQINSPSGNSMAQSGQAANGAVNSSDPAVAYKNVPATQPKSSQEPVYSEQIQVTKYRSQQLGTEWGTKADTTVQSFRIQPDIETAALSEGPTINGQKFSPSGVAEGDQFFSRKRWLAPQPTPQSPAQNATGGPSGPVTGTNGQKSTPKEFGINAVYYQRILFMQPFTDEKGYEVITPFPWGRWKSLLEAYSETRQGQIVDYVNPQDLADTQTVNMFLYAGMGTPQGSLEAGGALQDALAMLKSQIESKDSFELVPATATGSSNEATILSTQQPEDQTLPTDVYLTNLTNDDLKAKVNLFVQGTPQRSNTTQSLLKIALDEQGNNVHNDTND
jgi:hypothetical protein